MSTLRPNTPRSAPICNSETLISVPNILRAYYKIDFKNVAFSLRIKPKNQRPSESRSPKKFTNS